MENIPAVVSDEIYCDQVYEILRLLEQTKLNANIHHICFFNITENPKYIYREIIRHQILLHISWAFLYEVLLPSMY